MAGSKAGDVWKFVVPVLPCGSSRKKTSYPACLLRSSKAPGGKCKSSGGSASAAASSQSSAVVDVSSTTLQQLREEISAVGARVSYVDEQMEHIKAALPDLDAKIRYASLGMPLSSLSLEEMLQLKAIHFKLLQFWEELSRKQLEKLAVLADCLQVLEEQRASAKSKQGEEPSSTAARREEDFYQEFEQRVSEKVESDLRKNQELQMKLYVDRISTVTDHSKPTTLFLAQIPPERGPQGVFPSERQIIEAGKSKPRGGEPSELQSETRLEPQQQQLILNSQRSKLVVKGAPATPSTPASGFIATAGASAPTGRSLQKLAPSEPPRCKERGASAAPAPLSAGQPVQVPSSIQV